MSFKKELLGRADAADKRAEAAYLAHGQAQEEARRQLAAAEEHTKTAADYRRVAAREYDPDEFDDMPF